MIGNHTIYLAPTGDIQNLGTEANFQAGSNIPAADVLLLVTVMLMVAVYGYATIKGITLSIRAMRRGHVGGLILGLVFILITISIFSFLI